MVGGVRGVGGVGGVGGIAVVGGEAGAFAAEAVEEIADVGALEGSFDVFREGALASVGCCSHVGGFQSAAALYRTTELCPELCRTPELRGSAPLDDTADALGELTLLGFTLGCGARFDFGLELGLARLTPFFDLLVHLAAALFGRFLHGLVPRIRGARLFCALVSGLPQLARQLLARYY